MSQTELPSAQDLAPEVEAWDPHYCNIEENIDEFERRIKAEEARYAQVVANRKLYEQWMDPFECKVFFRESAIRLVNFDPNFDDPTPEPLPLPWEYRQSLSYNSQCGYY